VSKSPEKPQTQKLIENQPKEEKANVAHSMSPLMPQPMHLAGLPMHPMGHNMVNMGQHPNHPMAMPFMGQMMMMVPQMGMRPPQFMMQPMPGVQNFAPMQIQLNDKNEDNKNQLNDKKQVETSGMTGIPIIMQPGQFMHDFSGMN
jgi:hypothetical protein